MRIAINAVAVQGGGGRVYLENVLESLCAVGASHEFLVILAPHQQSLAASLPSRVRIMMCPSVPQAPWLRILWEQAILPVLLYRWRVDVFYAAYNMAVLLSPAPVVLLAHNINPYSSLKIPWSWYGRIRNGAYRLLGWLSAKVASKVVYVSETSARVMAPRMGVTASRMRVVHHGWRPVKDTERGPEQKPPERYLLAVGDLQPHKGYTMLIEAFERLATVHGYPGHLMIAGDQQGQYSGYARTVFALRDRLGCRERIHFLGTVGSAQLASLYRRTELFVFPSLEETFGLTLVEAMGAGVPVVAADWRLSRGHGADHPNVGPEVCGDAAVFFNPLDVGALTDAMQRVLEGPLLREKLIRKGQVRVASFSWDATATELVDIFQRSVRRTGRNQPA